MNSQQKPIKTTLIAYSINFICYSYALLNITHTKHKPLKKKLSSNLAVANFSASARD